MLAPNFIQYYSKGLHTILNSVRMVILNEDENLFKLIDVADNEDAFLEPFIFLYYANNKKGITLWQVLFGWIPEVYLNVDYSFKIVSDSRGYVYLPKVGYFKTDLVLCEMDMKYLHKTKTFLLYNSNRIVKFEFTEPLLTSDKRLEFYRFEHDLFRLPFDRYNISSGKKHIKTFPLAEKTYERFNRAYLLLKDTDYNYFNIVLNSLTGVYNYESEHYISFSDRLSYGISFLSGHKNDSIIYYLVELAHQTGHTILNTILENPDEFFLVDIHTPMSEITNNQGDYRNIYDAFHGLFTTSKVAETLDYFYDKKYLFSDIEYYELKGRLVDNSYRHKTGFHNIDVTKYFTKKGLEIYTKLDSFLVRVYKKHSKLLQKYPYVTKEFVFNFESFKKQFPLS